MINNHAAYKYKFLYKGPFVITQFCTNGTVIFQSGTENIKYKIRRIKPHTSDTKLEKLYFDN